MVDVVDKFLTIFEKISAIPRCSKHEEAIGAWLCNWAKEHKLQYKQDKAGNVLIKVPGTEGFEKSPVIIIQGHMDMVCEKGPGSDHNFQKDAIRLIREGDWLRADNTTLGADNGVAIVMVMMIVEENLKHPPLELLLTVDEETGLTGAILLEPDFLSGKILINLDSEDEGKFTIGCAGGRHSILQLPLNIDQAPENSTFIRITVSGLLGGHSGVDINKNRGCANRLLSRALYELKEEFSFNLVKIGGGTAHNAIAREASCVICIFPDDYEAIAEQITEIRAKLQHENINTEPDLQLSLTKTGRTEEVMTEESTVRAIDLILSLPHGISAMTASISDLVETSCNLALVSHSEDILEIMVSIRSSVDSRVKALSNRISAIAELAGARINESEGYPAWEPDPQSKLLNKCVINYQKIFDEEPEVLIIHAGLECSVIGKKYPGIKMISFGPTIENAHTPRECLNLPSFVRTWRFLSILLQEFQQV